MNHVVIMAGGIGSRFWPISTPQLPKQFIDILGTGRTLIQLTALRFEGVCPPSNVWVVTNASYVGYVRKQLPSVPENHILAEPAARNTAPCIAWACSVIRREDPDANVVVTPSDAFVADTDEFRRAMREALEFTAGREAIVTAGIRPTRPETGYGYIEAGDGAIAPVKQFREKPDAETARRYLDAGSFLWNAGIFVLSVRTASSVLKRYRPALAADVESMVESGKVQETFPSLEKISIDYAVMEPAASDGLVWTRPSEFGWSDLGNWASLYDKMAPDADGNACVGPVKAVECTDCLIHADGAQKVVVQGLDGYIVSLTDGRLLVCRRSEEQRIKEFI